MNDFSHSWIVVGLLRLLSPLPGLKKGRRFGEGRDQDFLRSTCQSRPPTRVEPRPSRAESSFRTPGPSNI